MVKVVVIGGSGHIGTYLIPHLISRSYTVISISRGLASPYTPSAAWHSPLLTQLKIDRTASESSGEFGKRIADLEPDIVIDLIAFNLSSVKHMHEALKDGKVGHYLFCSSIWVHGPTVNVPTEEWEPCDPPDEYGRGKLECEEYLMTAARKEGFPATSFRPGHIVGKGWVPLNPQGNFNPDIYSDIASGRSVVLPDLGLNTVHHIHADDIARWLLAAIDHRASTIGECFNVVSRKAITLRGFAEGMYKHFGYDPKEEGRIRYKALGECCEGMKGENDGKATREHVGRSPCASTDKSWERIGWRAKWGSLDGVLDGVEELIRDGKVRVENGEK